MADNDETDLVKVDDVEHEDDVTEARARPETADTSNDVTDVSDEPADADDPFAMQMESAKPGQTTIASLRERFSAFAIDLCVLWLSYWGCLSIFNKVMFRSWVGSVPTLGYRAMLFHGIFLLVVFLYFFLLEAVFFATIGKFCCWMYVRRKDGGHAGTLSILLRNFFRLIELVTAGLLTWIPMELTKRHQRLGDMAAGTIVIKKHSAGARYYPLDADKLASAFGRWLTWLIDIPLLMVWVLGYLMLINYQSIIVSQWLVLFFPIATLLFWSLVQVVLETTPGMWLFGYTVTQEDGGQLTFASALLRTLFAPLDFFFGFIAVLLSLRKQTMGDLVAATVVSRQRRRWKGIVGSLVVVAICVGLVALGLFINPNNNVFKAGPDFRLSFMPTVEGLPMWETAAAGQPSILTATNFRFGVEDANTYRTPPVYEAGEKVYLRFEISGYTRENRMIWVQEDLMVQYPDGAIGLRQENVVDYHQIVQPGGKPIDLTNNIALPPTAPPGTYVVTVTLRDMLANRFSITETQSFTVKAPPVISPPPVGEGQGEVISPPPAGEGQGEGAVHAPVPATPPATVPSSPIPVQPAAPQISPPPVGEGQGEGGIQVPAPSPSATQPADKQPSPDGRGGKVPAPGEPVSVPTTQPAPAAAPSGGFTVLPGPSLAPKEVTPPPIPVPTPVGVAATGLQKTVPTDPYSAMPVAPVTPPVPAAVPSAASKAVAPTPTPAAGPTPTTPPAAAPVAPAPSGITEKTLAPAAAPAVAPTEKTTVVKPSPKAPKQSVSDVQKAAQEELKRAEEAAAKAKTETKTTAPETAPAKPAAEIPPADTVKQEATKPPAKKKKSTSGVPAGGYMP